MTLTKAELADLLFEQLGLNKREAKDMVERFFEEIRIALEAGDSHIVNIDTPICLEKPKLAPYITQIQQKLAEVIGIPDFDVSVKAKTSEKMGFIGRGEGISAYAIALIE